MEKRDSFRVNQDSMAIYFRNNTEDRPSRGNKREDDWKHYKLFYQVANLICGQCHFEASSEPYPELTVCGYPCLWPFHRWGGNKYLRFEGHCYPAGFEFKFWYQGSRTGRKDDLGFYDFNKGDHATTLERLVFKNVARKVQAFLLSLGCEERGLEDGLKGRARVMWNINEDPGRHWGPWIKYKDEQYHVTNNARDKDGKTIENGQVKYFRRRDGRLAYGHVYHNINNMWWVVLNDFAYTNVACFDLFDATIEDLAKRRVKKDTSTPEDKARKKIGTKLFNEMKARGIKVTLEEARVT